MCSIFSEKKQAHWRLEVSTKLENGIFASLDIGTTSIKVIVAEIVNGQTNIIGVGHEKSRGLSRGIIVDIDQTVISIKNAVKQAEEKANVAIDEVIVGIPAYGLEIEPGHGMVKVAGDESEITDEDVQNVLAAAMVKAVPPERELLTVLPEEFVVDGFDGIRDPRGMVGVRLEMHALLLTVPKTIMHNIRRCVRNAGLIMRDVVVQPLAIGSIALTDGERDFGVVLVDMGGGQTTASAIHDNQLKFTHVDQEGGEYITKDISIVLNTTVDNAEKLKRNHGYATVNAASAEKNMLVEVVGQNEPVSISEEYLTEIIEARLVQIFEIIKEELDRIRALELPGGVVLTGGTSALPAIKELAEEIFGVQTKVYIPDYMGVRYPTFSTAIGLIQYIAGQDEIQRLINDFINGYENEPASAPVAEGNRPQQMEYRDQYVDEDHSPETKVSFWEKIKAFFASFFE
ncbi:cell division protein FtsA [Atopococcus tabaci]|uniref:cell division protein FtsA n=1 Tax=Atopococcus tabaci TaxID=269774 RepID=UPI003C6BFE15